MKPRNIDPEEWQRMHTPARFEAIRSSRNVVDWAVALHHGPPVEALAAITNLKRLVRREEERLVRAARMEGLTWHAIARCMEVPVQSVHRRWKRRLEGG